MSVNIREAAKYLQGPGRDKIKAKAITNRFRLRGILPARGGGDSPIEYDRLDIAICAVLAEIADTTRIRETADLKAIYAYLTSEFPGRDMPIIAAVLEDLAHGFEPILVLALFYSRTRQQHCVGCRVQLPPGELMAPPAPDFESAMQGKLDLLAVLSSFLESHA